MLLRSCKVKRSEKYIFVLILQVILIEFEWIGTQKEKDFGNRKKKKQTFHIQKGISSVSKTNKKAI